MNGGRCYRIYPICVAGDFETRGQGPVAEEGLPLLSQFYTRKCGEWLQKSVAFLALVAVKNGKSVCAAHRSVALVMKELKGTNESLAKQGY